MGWAGWVGGAGWAWGWLGWVGRLSGPRLDSAHSMAKSGPGRSPDYFLAKCSEQLRANDRVGNFRSQPICTEQSKFSKRHAVFSASSEEKVKKY